MKSAMLSTENLRLSVGKAPRILCDGLHFSLHSGELVALLGRNGSGKTTLLKALAGIRLPEAGSVFFDREQARDMPPRRRARVVALALSARQSDGILSGEEFVALGRWPHTPWHGRLSEADHRIIRRALEVTETLSLSALPMGRLSDGERQKLGLARALAQETPVVLLDEPLSHLDAPSRLYETGLLRLLAEEEGRAVLFSSHDLDLAFRSAHRHSRRLHR